MDDLAKLLGINPLEIRRKNMIRPTDWIESIWTDPSDVTFGSYGLDQCLDLVENALSSGRDAEFCTREVL
jgi:putative selenate reductase molybdopterin-binding subunit